MKIQTFVSEPHKGFIYIAEPMRKGSMKLIWSVMPEDRGADHVLSSCHVPLDIRRRAYHWFKPFGVGPLAG